MFEFLTPYNYVLTSDMMEHNNEPSLTVPDMSYSIQEMVDRFVRGQPVDNFKGGLYDPEDVTSIFEVDPTRYGDYDLTDRLELELELRSRLDALEQAKSSSSIPPVVDPTPGS